MISEDDGALCVIRGALASIMYTYRYSKPEWEKLMSRYVKSQGDYMAYLGLPYDAAFQSAIPYLDAFSCAQNSDNENLSTCYIYQPTWDHEGVTPRYPRFGTREWGI